LDHRVIREKKVKEVYQLWVLQDQGYGVTILTGNIFSIICRVISDLVVFLVEDWM